jgi:hypothetical protein
MPRPLMILTKERQLGQRAAQKPPLLELVRHSAANALLRRSVGATSGGEMSAFKCLYRAGIGGRVRSSEGIKRSLPGSSRDRPWSGRRDPYIHSVELGE